MELFMNITQKLSSKNLLIYNLVLIGAIFGFSLAFFSFSCSSPKSRVQAQESTVVIPENALAVAEICRLLYARFQKNYCLLL